MDDYKKLRANAKKAILDHLVGYSDTELRNWAAGKSVLASHDIQWFVELIFDLRRLQRQHTPASDGTYLEPSTGERVSAPKKEVVQDTEVELLRKDNEDLHERISSLLQCSSLEAHDGEHCMTSLVKALEELAHEFESATGYDDEHRRIMRSIASRIRDILEEHQEYIMINRCPSCGGDVDGACSSAPFVGLLRLLKRVQQFLAVECDGSTADELLEEIREQLDGPFANKLVAETKVLNAVYKVNVGL